MTTKQLSQIKKLVVLQMSRVEDSQHDLSHLLRVRDNALKIVKVLGLTDKIDSNLLEAICFLHDLTYVNHKTGLVAWVLERRFIREEVEKLLNKVEISSREKKIIIRAVVSHPHSFPLKRLNKSGDLYSQILQDSDTLDEFSKVRIDNFKKECSSSFSGRVKFFLLSPLIKYGKKNIDKFLNYPLLVNSFSVG